MVDLICQGGEVFTNGLDLRQSEHYKALYRRLGVTIEGIGDVWSGCVLGIPFASAINSLMVQRVDDPDIVPTIDEMARRRHSMFVRIAPRALVGSRVAERWQDQLARHGYSLDRKYFIAPPRTLLIDLSLSEPELLKQMKADARYHIRLATRKGVQALTVDGTRLTNDHIEQFRQVCKGDRQHAKLRTHVHKRLKIEAEILGGNMFVTLARGSSGEAASAASVWIAGDTATGCVSASTEQGRRDSAPSLVVWETLLEAKRRGCRWFDFDGVYDERYAATEDWKGFSQFKRGFGGQEVVYMGSFVKRRPLLGFGRG